MQHAQAKRRYADRYSNSAILSNANLDAIKERASTFLKQCTSQSHCEIYVCYPHDYSDLF